MAGPLCTIRSIDHLVLTVANLSATVGFYENLGMRCQRWSQSGTSADSTPRHSLLFGSQKINLHLQGHEVEPKAGRVQTGSGDLCFIVAEPVQDISERLLSKGIPILEGGGVVRRTGAKGPINSLYIRDPDGNLVE